MTERERIENMVFGDENEKFVGTKRNEENYEAVMKLQELAKRLKEKEDWLFEVDYSMEDAGKYHSSSAVYLDFPLPTVLQKKTFAKDILSQMTIVADEVSMAVPEGTSVLRMTFTVFDVWE